MLIPMDMIDSPFLVTNVFFFLVSIREEHLCLEVSLSHLRAWREQGRGGGKDVAWVSGYGASGGFVKVVC